MEEEIFVSIAAHQSGEFLEEVSAMRIAGCGCLVRTRSVVAGVTGLSTSESICFIPGVKIKEIKNDNGKILGHKLVSDTRKF